MGLFGSLFGKKDAGAEAASDAADGSFLSDFINIPSRDFFGPFAKSPNGRYTLAWCDGGPDQSRKGRYFLLDRGRIVVEGGMPRPNGGHIVDSGVFILNDWGSIETLSGTFTAFDPDGTVRFRRSLHANLFNNGLSNDGRLAVCQMANAPHEDGGKLFVFDLAAGAQIASWYPESGWANSYEFPEDGQTIRLVYRDRGAFAYGVDGTFIDRMRWLAVGLQVGDLGIVQTLLAETNNQPTLALVEQLLGGIDVALASSTYNTPKWRAIAFKLRGLCLEAIAEVGQALVAYDQALALDPKVGVKRKADQLRKVVP
ncbi:hypothetical protein HNR60_003295 [Rhodopseudomonas rhenobacensis]|uniref:Tetratricopeptide repeat protein n=1 Tax=Rhodopseudomonas rhenobacensis TaxID=87461 RepID=A0A7W8DZX2_9BRAD|nr:tetratricopeptide repeat protein [Rhodopseudomonas rhenobacensis]MBB5048528.1 hypothetical protein [Rhodopseudomonas rhenobacensis]